jgi:hypothetical protein
MIDSENEDIPLIEGDDEPDFEINPSEDDGDHDDPEMSDPQNLPPESFEADEDDDKGKEAGV